MSRRYGSKYAEVKNLSTTEIAKLIRADIQAAVAAGELPIGPTYSVRSRYFSGGSAIDITIQEWPGELGGDGTTYRVDGATEVDNRRAGKPWPWLTDGARAAIAKLEAIREAYNYDGSDIQTDYFDVNFYGSVEFESPGSARERARVAAKRAAAKSEPKKPRPDKRGLVNHVAEVHRRSYSWADKTRFDLLDAMHRGMHRHGRHAVDTNHTHEEGTWQAAS